MQGKGNEGASAALDAGQSREFPNGYVARSFRTDLPYFAEATGDALSPEFATFEEAAAWLAERAEPEASL